MLVDFPIFGAGINYFPTEISALRVFEPRYLLLIGDAIKDDKNFLVSKNLEELHQTVSEVRIIEHQDISNAEQLIIIEFTEKDTKIKVSKNNVSINTSTTPVLQNTSLVKKNNSSIENTSSGIEVKSPIIGTAYHSPEPGAKKFVDVGKKIKKGDTVMIVEAMKTMNHVPSTSDGIVKEICVEDGQPVEFGQTIIILE